MAERTLNIRKTMAQVYSVAHDMPYAISLRDVDNHVKVPQHRYWAARAVPQTKPGFPSTSQISDHISVTISLNHQWGHRVTLMDAGVGKSVLISGNIGRGKSTLKMRVLDELIDSYREHSLRLWVVDDILGPTHPVSSFQTPPLHTDPHTERVVHQCNPATLLREVSHTLRDRRDFLDAANCDTYADYLALLENPKYTVTGYRAYRMPPLVFVFDHLEDVRTHRVVRYLNKRGAELGVSTILVTSGQPEGPFDERLELWDGSVPNSNTVLFA